MSRGAFPLPASPLKRDKVRGDFVVLKRLDRYLLSQFMVLFGFFALVLVSVYWINRAVLLFDRLISDGQTAWVVIEFTALSLPNVIRLVLPAAAFAATIATINRLNQDSEFVVLRALGISPVRLAVPALLLGLIVALMMAALAHHLVPVSRARLADRETEVANDLAAQFLVEGAVQTPVEGLTMYIRAISDRGELEDVFISDTRSTANSVTYTAERAFVVGSDSGPKLILMNGMSEMLRASDQSLSVVRFSTFTFDLASRIAPNAYRKLKPDDLTTLELLDLETASQKLPPERLPLIVPRIHERIAATLLAPAAILMGVGIMMLGGFTRFGLWRQIVLATFIMVLLNVAQNAFGRVVQGNLGLGGLHSLPPLALTAVGLGALWMASSPRRRPRAKPISEGAAG